MAWRGRPLCGGLRSLGLAALFALVPSTPSSPPLASPFTAALPLAIGGCEALFVAAGHARCARAPETPPELVLWLPGSWRSEQLALDIDGEGSALAPELDPAGALYRLPLGTSGRVVLRDASGAGFVVELEPWRLDPGLQTELAELDELDALERELLTCALGSLGGVGGRAYGALALAELERKEEPPATLVDGIVAARGEVHCVDESLARQLYGALLGREDRRAAAQLLARLRHDPHDLEGRSLHDYFLGMVRERHGDLDGALEAYERTIELGRRVGLSDYLGPALSLRSDLLVRLGRYAEAQASAAAALAAVPREDPFWEYIELNATWVDYQLRERDPSAAPDPSPRLRALLEQLDSEGLRLKIAVNLAAALLQAGAVEAAWVELEAIERAQLEPHDRIYYELLGARLALAGAELELAREHLAAGELEARLQGDEQFMLELLGERARLEQLAGDPERALELYTSAETLADRLALQLPIDAHRHSFTSTLSRARARHIALLVERGRPREALCTILAARARHARALIAKPGRALDDPRYFEQVDAYRALGHELQQRLAERRTTASVGLPALDADIAELRRQRKLRLSEAMALLERDPPTWSCEQTWRASAGEALLTMHPAADQRSWWFVVARGEAVTARLVEPIASEDDAALVERALAELDLDPETRGLSGLSDLSVVPLGRLSAVDVHSLPRFAAPGAPRVRYRVALGELPEDPRQPEATELDARVLAFADNLAGVPAEAEAVRERLLARGWTPRERWTPSEPGRPTLLHYAGHGYHRGLSGWDSALAEGSELTSRALIAAQRSPRVVVLGACEAGSSDLQTIDGGMNIAFAFLLAGAELVIAADQPVADALALAFAEALYDELPAGEVPSTEHWLAALAEVTAQRPAFGAWRAWLR